MSLFKRNSAAVSITETKPSIQHAENANEDGSPRASKEKDVQPAAVTGCDGQIVDEETAKYLDSSIVIDAETNTQIKRMAIDKGTLAASSVMGIQTDNKLHGQQYALLGTILYIGILIGELPVNQLIQRVRVAKFLGSIIICWGILVCCHAACHDWSSLMAVRFLLGLCEAGVQPCLMTLTAMYYRRVEHPTIISYWYCQQGVQLMVSGLLSFALLHIKRGPVKSWQALFILCGGLSICWGTAVLLFLPDSPMKAKCWDDERKTLILERLRVNEQGVQNRHFKSEHLRETLKDPVVWTYLVLQLASFIIVGGLAVFANIIVKGLGFTTYQTQLLNLAQGAWSILIYIGSAWMARSLNQTILIMIAFMTVALIGTIVLDVVPVTHHTAAGLLIAFYLANCCIVSGNLLWSLVTRNIAGQTKKTTVFTLMFVAFALGNIIGPQVFRSTDSPRYHNAFAGHIALYAFFIVMSIVLRILLMRRNSQRKTALAAADGSTPPAEDAVIGNHRDAFSDLTDLQNTQAFLYMY
ncbi:MAG: hypothetical protein TREMPRED_001963 [Tremellales sp. Tagirdzhanova-0007]|nr:MAG: hypothetical protein TREMPRED_001963 [Tremellales sp. Tagirdzhanova-0007]